MNDEPAIRIRCSDALRDNPHVYARKARRKKIALVRLEVTNPTTAEVVLVLRTSRLMAHGKSISVEPPASVLRSLSEFTWDFILYSLVDFHPVTALIDVGVFLTGPIYNRRLKRQLALLSDDDLRLGPGETCSALLAFRGVNKPHQSLTILVRRADQEHEIRCDVNAA